MISIQTFRQVMTPTDRNNESQFDDRILCLSSSNKNFNNSTGNPDSLYSNLVESLSQSNNTTMTTIGDNDYVVVYPNPANTLVTIQYSCKEEGTFELMNNLGQTVLTNTLPKLKKQTELQLNGLSKGVYYYRCRFQECHDFYGKLTIQK